MKKEIQDYTEKLEKKLTQNLNNSVLEEMMKDFLIRISFYQHERFIHLIVLVTTVIVEILFFVTLLITNKYKILLAIMPTTGLLIGYTLHYFYLENAIQHLYTIYDEINLQIKSQKKNLPKKTDSIDA